jgi:hypothetical protein
LPDQLFDHFVGGRKQRRRRVVGHDDIHGKSDQIACGGGDLFSALASALIMTHCV